MSRKPTSKVRAWEESVTLPTYPAQAADPNPLFLEKRVYQGSSGKVYPNPFTDRVSTEKRNQTYSAVFLENEYVRVMVLPEIGGRIHIGQDKTNGYDFFYRQNVIKPALVGLAGPWISGGVEFNWPQHHRPSTYMPVHATIEHGEDGSATVWLSEHDPMLRMKGMAGICLHPGRSVIEAKVRLYNRTSMVQTFLWWANVAVRVHDRYQAFFPPDVTFVADHAKRAVSHFPLAKNFYYGVDYTSGVDLRWYKNIPVPTSYMVTKSNYDFMGGYDFEREAGLVQVADRHIAPGKKLWTWGSGEFGKAWDRNLTDSDGPYIELMAGVYTDNQPDFSWLAPYETKTFSQFWYPIQKIGPAVNANERIALSLTREDGRVRIGVCASEVMKGCAISVRRGEKEIFHAKENLAPGKPWLGEFKEKSAGPLYVTLRDAKGALLLEYREQASQDPELPEPATEPPSPSTIESSDELYITGLHIEQYRHGTRSPALYWNEGLRRDAGDSRMNNAMGLAALRQGHFAQAEEFFRTSIARLTRRNPNPRDGEPFYNLGLALAWQQRFDEAYSAFYKSFWNYAWRDAASYALAQMANQTTVETHGVQDGPVRALAHLEEALRSDPQNLKARDLKAAMLRRLGRKDEARALVAETLRLDALDFFAMAERMLLEDSAKARREVMTKLDGDVQTALDVAFDYAHAGLFDDALRWLKAAAEDTRTDYPMVFYTLAWLAENSGPSRDATAFWKRAAKASPLYCFPARLEEMVVLERAIERQPKDARANYYLGNLYYDRRRYDNAIACWRASVAEDSSYSIPWRNLGIAEFNVRNNPKGALEAYHKAIKANPHDARLLYEIDQLKKRTGHNPKERLRELESRPKLVAQRDDLSVEHAALLNLTGQHERARSVLLGRRFSPWEGGEGLVSGQWVEAHVALGRKALAAGDNVRAASLFAEARKYPENLGEGKHLLTLERQLDYWQGLAHERMGDNTRAAELYKAAAQPLPGPSLHSYYRALALRQLGREKEAGAALSELAEAAEAQRKRELKIDYFATSLPNFLLFEDDLDKRNAMESLLLEARAKLGQGQRAQAHDLFAKVIELDPSNAEAKQELEFLNATPTEG